MARRLSPWAASSVGPVLRYGVAVGAGVGFLLLTTLSEAALQGVVFTVPIALVALATLALGPGPGLVLAAIVGLGSWVLFQQPDDAFSRSSARESVRLAGFMVASAVVVGAIELLHRTGRRLEQAQAALRDERDFTGAIVDTAGSLVLVLDREGRIVRFNRACEELSGYAAGEVIGRTFEVFVPADELPEVRRTFERLLASAAPVSHDNHWVAKDGSRRLLAWSNTTIRAPDGRVRWVVGTAIDVTEQRAAEEELRRAQGLLQGITRGTEDLIAAEDADFRYLFFNEAYRREFRKLWNHELSVGDSMLEVLAPWPEEQRKARDLWARALAGESFRVTREFGPEGAARQTYDLQFNVLRDDHGNGIGAAHILRNVTEQVRAGRALEASETRAREAAAALRVANERYRLAGLATSDAVWDWDLRSNEVTWSEAIEATFGHRLPGMRSSLDWWSEQLHPDDRARVVESLLAVVGGPAGSAWSAEYRLRRGDGRWAEVLDRGMVLRDETGHTVRMIGSVLDLSERKEAERRLRRVLDASPMGAVLADTVGRVFYANQAYLRIIGHDARQLEAGEVRWDRITPPEHLEKDHRAVEQALSQGVSELYEKEYRRPDGARVPVLLACASLGGGELAAFVLDVTARKRAEEELRSANERLREADRRKDEFLAVLSHELRNPLAPIRNSVHVLGRAPPGSEPAKRALQVIDRQTRQMTRLIEDLLDVTRISRGKISLRREPIDLRQLARATAEDHRDVFARNGLVLAVEADGEPLWVEGDATRLAQVIGNLLHNAAKFTPSGGRAVLSVESREAAEAIVRVRDDGAGMSSETLAHVFEAFVQAQQTIERTRGGLGLGLALVKGLVELHGGTVSARSDGEGRGAEFTVALPFQADVARTPAQPHGERDSAWDEAPEAAHGAR